MAEHSILSWRRLCGGPEISVDTECMSEFVLSIKATDFTGKSVTMANPLNSQGYLRLI